MVGRIILSFILFFLLTPLVYFASAQEVKEGAEAEIISQELPSSVTPEAEVTQESVEYELAYPGMLPDNPLYFLKAIRDAIVKFLTSDPLKEAEFNILTANKRAYAALLLSQKEEYELMLETISKSSNYLHDATVSLSKAQEQNLEIDPLVDNARKSVKKHEEVFSRQILPSSPDNIKDDIENEIQRLKSIGESVENLASN